MKNRNSYESTKNYQDCFKQANPNPEGNYVFHSSDELTEFQRPYNEAFTVSPKSEMPEIMQSACENCKYRYRSQCEKGCKLYHNYCYWYKWAMPGPRVIYKTEPVKRVVRITKHKITPKMHCTQIVSSQITKFMKKYKDNNALFDMQKEVDCKTDRGIPLANIRNIYKIAKENGFNTIVDTINDLFNGKLGTIKTENK